jgi:hypothetical protein
LGILQKAVQQLVDSLTDELKYSIEGYASRLQQRVLRTLVLGGLGVTFLAAGSVFVLLGVVAYLSQLMFGGLAWGVVGLIAALVGGALLLLVRR